MLRWCLAFDLKERLLRRRASEMCKKGVSEQELLLGITLLVKIPLLRTERSDGWFYFRIAVAVDKM